VTAAAPLTEGGGPDVPQRVVFPLNITIADATVFSTLNDTRFVQVQAVGAGVVAGATLRLTKQPNPYMVDGDPYWLSTDVRVFKLSPNGTLPGSMTSLHDPSQDPDAPLTFINSLLQEFRGQTDFNNDPAHPFEKLTQDEAASSLEQSQTVLGKSVYNFAVAKVRYRANVTAATGVQVFFRTFMTMRSALDYTYAGTNPLSINYTRSGAWPNAVPLLGAIDGEIASIPYFAVPRIDSTNQPMTAQPLDMPNVQTINAVAGEENVMFFGVWLDFNQPSKRFPQNPSGTGPFGNAAQAIPTLINGLHQCLVAEICFQPGGGADPIPSGANPATSDRLAQRNLAIDNSGNPGWPQTHAVAHTFMLRPSASLLNGKTRRVSDQAAVIALYPSDELLIEWTNVPKDTQALLYFPDLSADTILQLAASRQHPQALTKIDDHTLAIQVSDVTFIPMPPAATSGTPGLITLTLPSNVRVGQIYRADFHQIDRNRRRIDGSFRFTIPVTDESQMLPQEVRHLAFLRYVAESRSPSNRWTPIFSRWTSLLADKVRALGGDPNTVPASLTDPTPSKSRQPHADRNFIGKVMCLRYDCFGDFEGFVLACCGCEEFISASERAIERVVHRAFIDRSILLVAMHGSLGRIQRIEARATC
jgi:hypothetical protein